MTCKDEGLFNCVKKFIHLAKRLFRGIRVTSKALLEWKVQHLFPEMMQLERALFIVLLMKQIGKMNIIRIERKTPGMPWDEKINE